MDYRYYINTINTINNSLHEIVQIYRNQQFMLNNMYYTSVPGPSPTYPATEYPNTNNRPEEEERREEERREEERREEERREEEVEREEVQERREVQDNTDTYIQQLIEDNVQKMRFGDIANPVNTMCPITREEFVPDDEVGVITHCGHIFNYNAVVSWLSRNFVCPLCRHDIRGTREGTASQILTFNEIVERISRFLNTPPENGATRPSSMLIRLSNGRRRRRLNPEPEPEPELEPDNN